jgi:hypothetical protein
MRALRVHLELLPGIHHIREQLLVRRGKSGDLCLKLRVFLFVLLGISLVGIVLDLVLFVLILGLLELALHALKFLVQLVELLLEGFWGGPTRIDLRGVQGFLHLFHGGREYLKFADDDSLVELHANLCFDARYLVQIQRAQAGLRLLYQLNGRCQFQLVTLKVLLISFHLFLDFLELLIPKLYHIFLLLDLLDGFLEISLDLVQTRKLLFDFVFLSSNI